MFHISFLQATVLGVVQGVTELFPVSSLGHSVLLPALIGGSWKQLVTDQSAAQSPYLAFIVALHVATASALLCFFWRDWVKLIAGLISSIRKRRAESVYEKMAWLIVIATIPAGVLGLALERTFRTIFAKPEAAAAFLALNGIVLAVGERLRRRPAAPSDDEGRAEILATAGAAAGGAVTVGAAAPAQGASARSVGSMVDVEHDSRRDDDVVNKVRPRDAAVIGVFQSFALLAGISRSGITMLGGLLRGLTHEQAVRFGFLLATPVIFGAGVYKLPDLAGHLGDGVRAQALVGAAAAFVAAIVSTRFLVKWFQTRTLTPFAIYCFGFGAFCMAWFA